MLSSASAVAASEEAKKYLDQNKIPTLVHHLTSALLFYRPDNPKDFLIEQLSQLQDYKNGKIRKLPLLLFDKEHLTALFKTLDVPGKGTITLNQYHAAMKDIGAQEYNHAPSGVAENAVTLSTFLIETEKALAKIF